MSHPITLSVVVAVAGGPIPLRRCLTALCEQIDNESEIIVPYDQWCEDIAALSGDFPRVRFHRIDGPGGSGPIARHRLYERRRAVGLTLAQGTIVALTEDYAVPAPDWCREILAAHALPHPVIGGAIENGIDRPMNWALYYCDFGRHGRPFAAGPALYVSDVNVSYKHSVLTATAEIWRDAYQETTLHWHLRARGYQLHVDPRPVVIQHRTTVSLASALRERMALGRAFGETRAATLSAWQRALYTLATPIIPLLLLYRCAHHMVRQRRTMRQIVTALPLLAALLSAYALGEGSGYLLVPRLRQPRQLGNSSIPFIS